MGGRVHLSLLVSISPNSSLLPPLLELAADVADAADAADDMLEKDADGLQLPGAKQDAFSPWLPIAGK